MHSQPNATRFRHSAALSVPAVLLRALPINQPHTQGPFSISRLPIMERGKGKQLHRPKKLIAKRFRAPLYFFNEYGKTFTCVNNKMLEYDWLLTALILVLIGCYMSKLSDLTHRLRTFAIKQ